MNNLSERVQREFDTWKGKYEIPYDVEFQVKTLLKLQEEYDNVEASSNTTRTRDTLLHMIQDLSKSMRLEPKNNRIGIIIDITTKPEKEVDKIIIYTNDVVYILNEQNFSIKDYANTIANMFNEKEFIVAHINTNGIGFELYNELFNKKRVIVKPLKIKNM